MRAAPGAAVVVNVSRVVCSQTIGPFQNRPTAPKTISRPGSSPSPIQSPEDGMPARRIGSGGGGTSFRPASCSTRSGMPRSANRTPMTGSSATAATKSMSSAVRYTTSAGAATSALSTRVTSNSGSTSSISMTTRLSRNGPGRHQGRTSRSGCATRNPDPVARAGVRGWSCWWRCRESNPGLPCCQRGFSERSR